MDSEKPSSSSSRVNKPLKRGRACMNCRFLKIKCDGHKPVCGPCKVHPRDDECEYADGPGRSRTKALEDTVARLEARLLELEQPESSTPSVTLHDPYLQRISSPVFHADSPTVYGPFSPTSTTSSLPSGSQWQSFSALEAKTESTSSSGSSSSHTVRRPVSSPFLGVEEPPLGLLQSSIDKFIPHAEQFGFFLHIPTFKSSALLAFPLGHSSRPTPGLLHTVHLFGTHFLQPEALYAQEAPLLTRAVQYVATDLLGVHPDKVIYTMQAEILLAYYFLRTGMLLEAKHRTGAAVALALGSGLHKIYSPNMFTPSTIGIVQDQPYSLPLPKNGVQAAERINGFWAVVTLHKFIRVALECPAQVCGALEAPGMQIDTPWPIDMSEYQEGVLPHDLQGDSTVRDFLNGHPPRSPNGDTLTALVNKAAILYHRAAHLTGQWIPGMNSKDRVAYDAAARSINALIESSRASLAPLPPSTHSSFRACLLLHSLVEAASIKLHWIFAYAYSSSKEICISAAFNMIKQNVNLHEIGYINPVMGNLWMIACHVFIDEISRVRHLGGDLTNAPYTEDDLMEGYRSGLNALSLFSQDSILMRYQLTKVQEAFEAI